MVQEELKKFVSFFNRYQFHHIAFIADKLTGYDI